MQDRNLDPAQLEGIARSLGPLWGAVLENSHHGMLIGPTLFLHVNAWTTPGRLSITPDPPVGTYYTPNSLDRPFISVSKGRTPLEIAEDISNRLLNRAETYITACIKAKAKEETYRSTAARLGQEALMVCPSLIATDEPNEFQLAGPCYGKIRLYLGPDPLMTIEHASLPITVGMALLKALNNYKEDGGSDQ